MKRKRKKPLHSSSAPYERVRKSAAALMAGGSKSGAAGSKQPKRLESKAEDEGMMARLGSALKQAAGSTVVRHQNLSHAQ